MTHIVLVANSDDGTISSLRLSVGEEPKLEHLALFGPVEGCSTFAVNDSGELVFAGVEDEGGPGIVTLKLDKESGDLTQVARRSVEDKVAYLQLTDRSTLLGASYHGGWLAAWPVDGEWLGEPHSRYEHANLHSIIQAGDNVYAASLGDDLLAQFRIEDDGHLTPLEPATVAAPKGSGPRHVVATGDNVYLVTEFSGELIRCSRGDDGALTVAQQVSVVDPADGLAHSRYGADPREEHLIWGADVHLADGYVISSERTGSKLAVTELREDGSLGEVVGFTSTSMQPRGFAVTGDLVISVGEKSTEAQLLRLSPAGELNLVDTTEVGNGANWVRVIS